MQQQEHIEAEVTMKQTVSWALVIQIIAMLLPAAGVYAALTGNDREMQAEIKQLRADQIRIESNTKDLKTEIKQDLASIISEIRDMRADINRRTK